VVSDVVGDIPDLAMRLKRVLIRLDETGTGDARRLERFARNERWRAIWSTLALWGIAIGALVLAFRGL
jgi:ubiquinone biosynthesis protein